MKKRLISWLLTFAMLFSMLPSVALTASAAETEAAPEKQPISESTYDSLGLKVENEVEDESYLGPGNTTLNTKNELYFEIQGSSQKGFSIRDNIQFFDLTRAFCDELGEEIEETAGAYQLYHQYKNGEWANLSESKGYNMGQSGGAGTVIGESFSNKSNGRDYAVTQEYRSDTGKLDRVAQLFVKASDNRANYRVYLEILGFRLKDGKQEAYALSKVDLGRPGIFDREFNDNSDYEAFFQVTAGDYNGDGLDEVAVYYANNVVRIYTTEKDQLKLWKELALPTSGIEEAKLELGGTKQYYPAVVSLATGDLKKDFTDDLIIGYSPDRTGIANAVNSNAFGGNSEKIAQALRSMSQDSVIIYGLKNGEFVSNTVDIPNELLTEDIDYYFSYLQGVSVAVGDLTGSGIDEVLVAGYPFNTLSMTSNGLPTDMKVEYYKLSYNRTADEYSLGGVNSMLVENTWGLPDELVWEEESEDTVLSNYTGSRNEDWPSLYRDNLYGTIKPVPLGIVDLGGMSGTGNKQVLVNFRVFQWEDLSGRLEDLPNGRLRFMQEYITNNADEDVELSNVWVSDVLVGNFNGNDDGKEQVLAVIGMQQAEDDEPDDNKGRDYYWYQLVWLSEDDKGNIVRGAEGIINQATSYLWCTEEGYWGSPYVALSAPDVDDDSILLDYKDTFLTYTSPEVQAVLQSAPYFQDVEDAYGYLSNGATAYGRSEGSSESVTAGVSASAGIYVSTGVSFIARSETEVEVKAETSYDHATSWETTTSVEYAGSVGDDYVVVYTIPYYNYYYRAYDPRSDTWGDMIISEPQPAVTMIITVDQYDQVANVTEGLDPIRNNILDSTPGVPSTYTANALGGAAAKREKIGDRQKLNNGGAVLTTVSQESSKSKEHSFSVGAEVSLKFGVGVGLEANETMVGFTGSVGASVGGVFSSMEGVAYTLSVDGMPNEVQG